MKKIKLLISIALFAFALDAQAGLKSLDEVLAKATAKETQDLAKLLQQIQMVPLKSSQNGKQIMKVTHVDKGSVWDREGIKVGDLMTNGSTVSQPGKPMELNNQLKSQAPAGSPSH